MRILHTSDWHLGRSLHGADLSEAADAFLEWLIAYIQANPVDALLVSGDIFDRALPPIASLRRLSSALETLCDLTTVVITPGNHDSATRLGFAARLIQPQLRIISDVADIGRPVEIGTGDNGALIYPLPYLEPDLTRHSLSHDDDLVARSHEAVISAALRRIRSDLYVRRAQGDQRAAICMVHAFISGGAPSDSERDIQVGGVDSIPAAIFDSLGGNHHEGDTYSHCTLSYIAAGHLHRAQNISGATVPIRYSGSPLAYSFSEVGVKKSVTIVTLSEGKVQQIDCVEIPEFRPLAQIRDSLENLLSPTYEWAQQSWLHITVTDTHRPPELVTRLRDHFPYALVILHEGAVTGDILPSASIVGRTTREIAQSFFSDVGGRDLNADEHALLDDILTAMRSKDSQ